MRIALKKTFEKTFTGARARRLRAIARGESGITIMIVLGFTLLAGSILAAAYAATQHEVHLSASATAQKKAYYAAQYGISSYLEHLLQNGSYLGYCTKPPEYESNPSANPLNNAYKTTSGGEELTAPELHKVPVPGTEHGAEEYAIQLLPQANAPAGEKYCNPNNIAGTMIEQSGEVAGTFRIKVTGFSRLGANRYETRSVVASFKNEGFVSFVYYTVYETADPASYPSINQRSRTRQEAEQHCEAVYGQRESWCEPIYFVTGDEVRGPMHTQDHVGIIGSPVFGRSPNDKIEFGTAVSDTCGHPDEGYSEESNGYGCGTPSFVGQHIPPSHTKSINPPPSDQEIRAIAEQGGYVFEGATEIILEHTKLRIKKPGTTEPGEEKPFPANGVIYVKNSGACAGFPYYDVTYPGEMSCGNAFVRGYYEKSLTIATQNDLIIDGNVETASNSSHTPTGSATLGLIAQDFVRVYHPVARFDGAPASSCRPHEWWCGGGSECPTGTTLNRSLNKCEYVNDNFECTAPSITGEGSGENPNPLPGTVGTMSEPVIEAAMLALNHSFTVDNYLCPDYGSAIGTLVVRGAVAQRFRGIVGVHWGSGAVSGYYKNYEYDNRLQATEPPHFLNPVEAAWQIERETLAPAPAP
jgi:hypothetical protein